MLDMKQKSIKLMEDRQNRTHYDGQFSNFQEFGNSYRGMKYSISTNNVYSPTQNLLYKRALFGLKMYSQEEVKAMHWEKRKRIIKVHKKTQKELNFWKQSKLIEYTNKLFGFFGHSILASDLINSYSDTDPDFKCTFTFKELGIKKEDIIERLLTKGLLPNNFLTLSSES